jgi:Transposase DDE domain
MASVSASLQRIRQDLSEHLPDSSIVAACEVAGHHWRERKLGPVITVQLFMLQALWFNTAIEHLRRLAGFPFAAAAYCEARVRLPLAALQQLLLDSSASMRAAGDGTGREAAGLWHGLRALLVDGSSTITPDTPSLQNAFGQPSGQKPGCGFPVPKTLGLFDAFTGMIVEMIAFPLFTHEQSQVWQLHPLLKEGDLLVGDRGFCSFVHLAMLQARGVMACFRLHQRQTVDFRAGRKSRDQFAEGQRIGKPTSTFLRRLGYRDQVVSWKRPPKMPQWMNAAQWALIPESLEVRELQYTICANGQRTRVVTIATTLLNPLLYPKEAVAELYGVRWQAETHFAELKTTLKMRKLKCKTEDGIRKEMAIYCLIYNLVRAVMVKAAAQQGVTPDRISFIDTIRWLTLAKPGEAIPKLVVNKRRDRHEPRVIKDLQDTYRKMTRPRHELRKELKNQGMPLK